MGDVRMSAKAVAAKALRVTGCSPEDAERFAGAFVAVAEAVRDDVVSQVVQTAVVRPGDTLILRLADHQPMEYIDRCSKAIREKLPDVEVLFIGGVDEMALYRPEAAE
jgi:hypothetical protein